MKKRMIAFLLLIVMLSLMTVSAVAAEATEPTVAGIYGIEGSGITPKTESDGAITPTDIGTGYKGFYADAVKFDVSASGLTAGEQYLLLVLSDNKAPGDENIVYINQAASNEDGAVSFTGLEAAYPSSLVNGNTYYVYLVGLNKTFTAGETQIASFEYYQPYKLGDINDDTFINVADAAKVIDHFLERDTLTGNALLAANVNGDGFVNVSDAAMIIDLFLERIDSFE